MSPQGGQSPPDSTIQLHEEKNLPGTTLLTAVRLEVELQEPISAALLRPVGASAGSQLVDFLAWFSLTIILAAWFIIFRAVTATASCGAASLQLPR